MKSSTTLLKSLIGIFSEKFLQRLKETLYWNVHTLIKWFMSVRKTLRVFIVEFWHSVPFDLICSLNSGCFANGKQICSFLHEIADAATVSTSPLSLPLNRMQRLQFKIFQMWRFLILVVNACFIKFFDSSNYLCLFKYHAHNANSGSWLHMCLWMDVYVAVFCVLSTLVKFSTASLSMNWAKL